MARGVDIVLNARLDRWSSQLDRATQDLNRFQSNASRVGQNLGKIFSGLGVGLSVAGFTGIIKSSIDAADKLKDLSKSTGLTVELLSGLQLAARQSGTDLDSVAESINKLSVNIGKNAGKFKELGIDAKDPLEAFKQLADVFAGLEDPQLRAAVAAAALGKSWQNTAPLLAEGGRAIGDMVAKGSQLSGITSELADNADQFNDKLEVMRSKLAGVGVTMAGPILDSFLKLSDYVSKTEKDLSGASIAFDAYGFAIKGAAKIAAAAYDIFNRAGLGVGALAAKATALARLDFNGFSVIDDAFNDDIKKASKNYDDFVKQLENPVKTAIPKDLGVSSANQSKLVNKANAFVGGNSEDQGSRPRSVARLSIPRSRPVSRGSIGGGDDGSRELENLKQQIALFGEVGEAARVRYEIEAGSLKNISAMQKSAILNAADQLDFYKEMEEVFQVSGDLAKEQQLAMKQSAEQAAELKRELADTFLPPTGDFEKKLYQIDDALKKGIFTAKEAKQEFDKVGLRFNQGDFDTVKEEVNGVSEFALQASRNLQNSLSTAISSGFKGGLKGMLTSFGQFLADAAAEAASSKLLELFSGKNGKGGLFDAALSGLGGLFSSIGSSASSAAGSASDILSSLFHDGGMVGATGGKAVSVPAAAFIGAKRYHSGGRVGLKHDEVPAILQRGEAVLNRSQVKQVTNASKTNSFDAGFNAMLAKVFHAGGTVGNVGGPSITVSPSIFVDAPRFHSGGGVSLKNNEVPAILQTGEFVLSRDQVKNSTRINNNTTSSSSAGGNTYNVAVTVNQTGNESPEQTGTKIAESLIRAISREEIKNANRIGNVLKPTTSFG
jgi:hypothetical protein